jgi:hypothetical protein
MQTPAVLGGAMSKSRKLCCFAILAVATATAQAKPPKYDLQTEAKMKGVVEELKLPTKGSEVAYLLVKDGTDTLDVYLCPKSFLDEMGVNFNKGAEVAFIGSKVKENGADLILAREVVNGNDTVVFRDEKGKPVWSH